MRVLRSPKEWSWVRRLLQLPAARLLLEVQRRSSADSVGARGAALAYYGFLSLFPLLLVGLSVLSYFLSPKRSREIVRSVGETIPGLEDLVGRNLDTLARSGAALGILGLILLLWTASGAAQAVRQALAEVFRAPKPGLVGGRLEPIGIMVILGALGIISIVVTTTAASWSSEGFAGMLLRLLAMAVTLAVDLGAILLAFFLLTPRGGPTLREHLPGGLVMTIAWTGIKVIGSWYATRVVVRSSALYGTIGAVFGLLVILQLTSTAFLYAAELTAVLRERHPGASIGDPRID